MRSNKFIIGFAFLHTITLVYIKLNKITLVYINFQSLALANGCGP